MTYLLNEVYRKGRVERIKLIRELTGATFQEAKAFEPMVSTPYLLRTVMGYMPGVVPWRTTQEYPDHDVEQEVAVCPCTYEGAHHGEPCNFRVITTCTDCNKPTCHACSHPDFGEGRRHMECPPA